MKHSHIRKMIPLLLALILLSACGGKKQSETLPADTPVDLDLTEMSATVVYGEVYQIMFFPEDYFGRTMKMAGTLARFQNEDTGEEYYTCMISDATACCAQGIPFYLADSGAKMPAEGDPITLIGTFGEAPSLPYPSAALQKASFAAG